MARCHRCGLRAERHPLITSFPSSDTVLQPHAALSRSELNVALPRIDRRSDRMPPRNVSIKNLAEVVAARASRPAVMRPQKVNGNWHMPKMSARAIARRRKEYLQAGKEWPWDVPHKIVEKRVPFKGHKRDLRAVQKREEIARCMARMPALVEQYRANRPRKQKAQGFALLLRETREEAERKAQTGKKGKKGKESLASW